MEGKKRMNILTNPAVFNWLIIAMFIAAAIRWACAGNLPQTVYWIAGACLNIAVLFMDGK